MKYHHRFIVRASVTKVVRFHAQSDSLLSITPPLVKMQIHRAPELLSEGNEIDFTLWFGPFPVRWVARIDQQSASEFTDRQLSGPYRDWTHRHTFLSLDNHHTEVRDEIELLMKKHPWWFLVGTVMWASLPILFTYRARQTKIILEK